MKYNAILQEIDPDEVRRYAGLKNGADFPESIIQAACREMKILADSKGSWEVYPYDAKAQMLLSPTHYQLSGKDIGRHLASCQEVAILAVTVGKAIEQEIHSRFKKNEYSAGLILDAAATTAVEIIADKLEAAIIIEAARKGLKTTSRYSPGYGDWAIQAQPEILNLSGGRQIGIDVNASYILTPRKSVTAVIGLENKETSQVSSNSCQRGCAYCLNQNCHFRKEPYHDQNI